MRLDQEPDVLVIGAGLAGLAASVALSGAGARVTVLERKPYVGGRAYSYLHPALEEEIDSQHVMLGCCTNLVDLCRLSGADRFIRWYDQIPFLEPATPKRGMRQSLVGPGGLPAPPGATWNFLRAPMLGAADKLAVVRGMAEFLRGFPDDDAEPFAAWLQRTGQTPLAVKHFWEPIVLATLNDTFERSSTRYVGKVVHETLLRNGAGGRLGIPVQPLSVFYDAFAKLAERNGASFRLRASAERLERAADGVRWRAVLSDGAVIEAGQVVLALPFEGTAKLLGTAPASAGIAQVCGNLQRFSHAPITTIHLWFDRAVTQMDHAGLLDTRIQWMFNKTGIRRGMVSGADGTRPGGGQYLELTISGSFAELRMGREEILRSAMEELAGFFPAVREARLVKSGVLKEARATFSVTPGLDRFRPSSDAPGDGLFLAGDWTRTGWPSTMEGAVRSGRLAAEAVARAGGSDLQAITADLPPAGLMRLLV